MHDTININYEVNKAKIMNLQTRLNNLNFNTQLEAVQDLLAPAQTKITFWGQRVVEVPGINGFVSLNALTEKIAQVANSRNDPSLAKRQAGLKIQSKLSNCYALTDRQSKACNIFTRFLTKVRDKLQNTSIEDDSAFFKIPFITPRMFAEKSSKFNLYTATQFYAHFGMQQSPVDYPSVESMFNKNFFNRYVLKTPFEDKVEMSLDPSTGSPLDVQIYVHKHVVLNHKIQLYPFFHLP